MKFILENKVQLDSLSKVEHDLVFSVANLHERTLPQWLFFFFLFVQVATISTNKLQKKKKMGYFWTKSIERWGSALSIIYWVGCEINNS